MGLKSVHKSVSLLNFLVAGMLFQIWSTFLTSAAASLVTSKVNELSSGHVMQKELHIWTSVHGKSTTDTAMTIFEMLSVSNCQLGLGQVMQGIPKLEPSFTRSQTTPYLDLQMFNLLIATFRNFVHSSMQPFSSILKQTSSTKRG